MTQPTTQYPIVINNRDRLKPLLKMLSWLKQAGQTEIYIVDNDSSYPPLLRYYRRCPYKVIMLGENVGHKAPWTAGIVERFCAGRFYAVSDPDVVPTSTCPMDALTHFQEVLERYPQKDKIGFGLKIDDIPAHYKFAVEVRAWESQFWKVELEPGVFDSMVDTTFALYRPGSVYASLDLSLRTGEPYVARHLPWYSNSRHLDAEERYYRAHTRPDLNHWDGEQLPERMNTMFENQGMVMPQPQPKTLGWFERLMGHRSPAPEQ